MTLEKLEGLNILVTSVSRKVPLIKAVKRAIARVSLNGKVIGGDSKPDSIARYFTDDFWLMPKQQNLYIQNVIDYCMEKDIKGIIPTRDGELEFFARHKDLLIANGIRPMVSSQEAVKITLDKLRYFEFCNTRGLPVIPTTENIEELSCYEYVVKERFGSGSNGVAIGLTKSEALEFAAKLNNPIFQPTIYGQEASIDVYLDTRGKTKGTIPRTRDLVIGGESQITTTFNDSNLESLSSTIVETIGLYGHVVLQAIINKNNEIHFIECNSRFGGASTLSIEAGLDTFFWFLLEISGVDIAQYPFERASISKKQIRYMEDLTLDTGI